MVLIIFFLFFRNSAEEEMSEQPKYNIDEELSAIKSSIMTKWREIEVGSYTRFRIALF